MTTYSTHVSLAQAKQDADDLDAIVKSLQADDLFETWPGLSDAEQISIAERAGLVRREPLTKSRLSDAPRSTTVAPTYNPADVSMAIERAVHDGKLPPSVLGHFSVRPLQTLASIPHDVCKSYNLPILSEPSRFPLEEVSLKLEKAVNDGKLPANFLGEFRRNTKWILANIPPDVRSDYGIPSAI